MTIKLIWQKLHIYQKVILIYILLLLPIFAVSFWINLAGATYIKSEVSNSIMSNVSFYAREFDNDLENIYRQQTNFLANLDIQKLSILNSLIGEYERTQMYDRILERLSVMKDSSKNIDNAGVYIKSVDRTLSIKTGVSAVPNTEYDILKKAYDSKRTKYIDKSQNRLYIIKAFSSKRAINFKSEDTIAYISIPISRINDELSGLSGNSGADTILYDDDLGFIIPPKKEFQLLKENSISDLSKKDSGTITLRSGNENYWVIFKRLDFSSMILVSYISENDALSMLKIYNLMFLILFIISVVITILFSFFINFMIHRPMRKLVMAFKSVDGGNLDMIVSNNRDDEFGYLYKAFNLMANNMKQSIEMNYIQKLALQQSELKQLQSQINPHFLYNCFYNISQMCKSEDMDTAYELSNRLGSYYRYITRSGSDEVSLNMEYKHALDYIEIQSIRFANRINVHIPDLPENYANLIVPRIILQPIIENAYEHAFEKSSYKGNIYVAIKFESEVLSIMIEDDGKDLDDEALSQLQVKLTKVADLAEKTGIVNVCRRIQLKYGRESGLFASRSTYGGLKIETIIKYEGMN